MRYDTSSLVGRAGRGEHQGEGASKRAGGSTANVEALEPRQLLATFSVTTLDDAGAGSLRQAILDANGAAGADVIEFDAGLTGTITLAGTELAVTEDVAITGPGANLLTVSGNNASRVFNFQSGTSTLSGLKVTGGNANAGGGLVNEGTLSLSKVVIQGNTATGPGGGIYTDGQLTVTDSAILGNTAQETGGLTAAGTVAVINSTISGNSAQSGGGGITQGGTFSIINSTISGNSSANGAGGIQNYGTLTVTNSTISENSGSNGGGISNFGALTAISTIVAGNTASATPSDISGTFAPGSTNNLIGDAATAGGLTNGASGNLVGVDPKLGALASNGGPTQTMALAVDSPAIGMGLNPSNLTSDQRGGLFARGTAVDIGAYQRQTLNLIVDTLSDVVDGNHSAGNLSLREAIDAAGPNPGNDTIAFATSLNGGTIMLGGTVLAVAGDVTITGPGAGLLTISGNNASRVFSFISGSSSLSGLTIAQGGIENSGTLALTDTTVSGTAFAFDYGPYSGGGIFSSLSLTLTNCTIDGNQAWYGPGITATGALTIAGSTISNNSRMGNGSGAGGGIQFANGTLTITNTTISGNDAGYVGGGAFFAYNSTVEVRNSTIANNSGGGVSLQGGSTVLISSIVAGNTFFGDPADVWGTFAVGSTNNLIQDAGNAGGLTNGVNGNLVGVDPKLGALASNGGPTQTMALAADSPAINKGLNPSNLTTDQRGGLFARGTAVDIGAYQRQTLNLVVDTLVDENDGIISAGDLSLREAIAAAGPNPGNDTITFATTLNGGTITLGGTELAVAGDVTITGPGANLLSVSGDGLSRVFRFASGSSSLSGLTITGGSFTLAGSGGGVFNEGTLTISDSTISGNYVNAEGGGGIRNVGTLTIRNSTISGNSTVTPTGGGGIRNSGTLTIANSTIEGNSSGSTGGILSDGTMTITNSTIAGNRAYSTGGISSTVTFQLISSIVAGNSRYDTVPSDIGSTLASGSTNNLIQDAASAGGLTNGVNGNLVGVDPKLGALASNGGPTQTMALAADSPAIGMGINPGNLTTDQRGTGFARTRGIATDIGAFEFTPVPVVGSLTLSALQVHRGQPVTFTANNVAPGVDGTNIVRVEFHRIVATKGGTTDVMEGQDTTPGDGWTYILDTSSLDVGQPHLIGPGGYSGLVDYYAVAIDTEGGASPWTISTDFQSFEVLPALPTVSSVTLSAMQVRRGLPVTFTANGVAASESGSSIVRVEFYRSVTTRGGTTNDKVGEDTTGGDGWTYVLDTSGMEVGQPHLIGPGGYNGLVDYYAVVIDSLGNSSTQVFSADFRSFEVQAGFPLLGSSAGGSGNLNIGSGSSMDQPTIYQQAAGSTTWTKSDLQAKTSCPDITGEIVSWVDAKDGRNYAAAMTVDGLGLFTNTTGSTWTFRNLSTEVAGIPGIASNLTVFISIDGLVNLAGTAVTSGDLIRWSQTGDGENGHYGWAAHNLSDDLRDQGLTVPGFTGRITSFVTSWNALNIVGLDASGQIQAVWWHQSLNTGGKWTTNNLSQEYGAPQLTGGLTVWLTAWNAINIGGTDTSGKLAVTWWVPGFNENRWNNNNLTDDIGGPILQADSVCSWVTPWGAMNIAGREADGTLSAYWWVPTTNQWNVARISQEIQGATPTIGPVTGITAQAGEFSMSIVSTSAVGDVIRCWWSPTTNVWAEQNLTQTAVVV